MAKNAKVKISRKVVEITELGTNIIAKDTADGAESKLNGINKVDFADKLAFALAKQALVTQYNNQMELAYQERNLALGIQKGQKSYTPDTVLFIVKKVRDFLLGHFRGLEKKLGEYGFEVNQNSKGGMRVVISRNPKKLTDLTDAIIAKDDTDGESSIIADMDIPMLISLNQEAKEKNALAAKLFRDRQQAVQQRNIALGIAIKQRTINKGTVLFYITSVRDILLGYYRGEEQTLGEWGFTVQAPSSPTPPTPTTTVEGYVRNASTQEAVSGVQIEFNTTAGIMVAVSDILGAFSANLNLDETELVIVTINHTGFQIFDTTVMVAEGEVNNIDFELEPEL